MDEKPAAKEKGCIIGLEPRKVLDLDKEEKNKSDGKHTHLSNL